MGIVLANVYGSFKLNEDDFDPSYWSRRDAYRERLTEEAPDWRPTVVAVGVGVITALALFVLVLVGWR